MRRTWLLTVMAWLVAAATADAAVTRTILPNALYGDCRPSGEFAAARYGGGGLTHLGDLPQPPEDMLFVRITPSGPFALAMKGHRTGVVYTWSPEAGWQRDGRISHGTQGHIFRPDGTLYVWEPCPPSPAGCESQGVRYWDNGPVFGTPTYGPRPDLGVPDLYEWTRRGDVVVGQGADSGTVLRHGGTAYLLEPGDSRFVQFHQEGDRYCVAITQLRDRRVVILRFDRADIPTFPRVPTPVPAPPAPPTPQPQPQPQPQPVAEDEIDPTTVTWLHTDVSRWPVTSKLTRVVLPPVGGAGITLEHTQAGRWPVVTLNGTQTEGNPWVFARIGGRWYGATFEWLRPGQTHKPVITAANIGAHTKRPPLETWVPQPGEEIGLMVSGLARDSNRNIEARTQIVRVRWPGGTDTPPPPSPPVDDPLPPTHVDLGQVIERLDRIITLLERMDPKVAQAAHEALQAALRSAEILQRLEARPVHPNYTGRVLGFPVTLRPTAP